MKRIVSAGCIFVFLFLVSCHSASTSTVVTETPGVSDSMLQFRITWAAYSGRGEAIEKIVDSYNKETGADTILMISGDEDIAAIQKLLEENAETIFVLPYRYVKYFSQMGYLTDLTASFKDSEALFYPQVWQLGSVHGVTYGVPWLGHAMCLLYNKDLLYKAGVDAASITDLSALVTALELVEKNTAAKGIGLVGADSNDVSWMVNQFIYGFGSSLVSDDGNTVVINNEKTKAALAFYRDILGSHAQPSWKNDTGIEVMTHFRNQEIAFEIQGIWGVTDIQKNGSPFDVGIISMQDVGLCAEVGPMMLAVPAKMSDKNKEAAIRFIRYLISAEAQEKIMQGEYSPERDTYYPFRTPIRTDMADSQIFRINPDYMKFIEGFQKPSIDMPVPAWQTIKDMLYQPGLHQLMLGEMTIDVFLDKIEAEGNKVLSQQK